MQPNPVDEARQDIDHVLDLFRVMLDETDREQEFIEALDAYAEAIRQEERSRYEGLLAAVSPLMGPLTVSQRDHTFHVPEQVVDNIRDAIAALADTSSPTVDTCATCGDPATQLVNVNATMNWTAPTKMEPRCAAHGLHPFRSSNSAATPSGGE